MSPLGIIRTLVGAAAFGFASLGSAQSGGSPIAGGLLETRAKLVEQSAEAERLHRPADAARLSARLKDGDFQEGDRIVVVVESAGKSMLSDTLTVRVGRVLAIPGYSQISLDGVLSCSEVQERITEHLTKNFLVNPLVRARPLIRLDVRGAVTRPGTYYTSPDSPVSDALMLAGGQAQDADWTRTIVRRAGAVTWNATDLQRAISNGMSIERLQMLPGDEVFVPRKKSRNWAGMLQIAVGIVTLGIALTR